MAQQLGALVVLAEDLSLSSNTHIAAPVPGSYMPSSGIQEPGIYVVHRPTWDKKHQDTNNFSKNYKMQKSRQNLPRSMADLMKPIA